MRNLKAHVKQSKWRILLDIQSLPKFLSLSHSGDLGGGWGGRGPYFILPFQIIWLSFRKSNNPLFILVASIHILYSGSPNYKNPQTNLRNERWDQTLPILVRIKPESWWGWDGSRRARLVGSIHRQQAGALQRGPRRHHSPSEPVVWRSPKNFYFVLFWSMLLYGYWGTLKRSMLFNFSPHFWEIGKART